MTASTTVNRFSQQDATVSTQTADVSGEIIVPRVLTDRETSAPPVSTSQGPDPRGIRLAQAGKAEHAQPPTCLKSPNEILERIRSAVSPFKQMKPIVDLIACWDPQTTTAEYRTLVIESLVQALNNPQVIETNILARVNPAGALLALGVDDDVLNAKSRGVLDDALKGQCELCKGHANHWLAQKILYGPHQGKTIGEAYNMKKSQG